MQVTVCAYVYESVSVHMYVCVVCERVWRACVCMCITRACSQAWLYPVGAEISTWVLYLQGKQLYLLGLKGIHF